jgi:hypothetical protein
MLFENATKLVLYLLIDSKPDKDGHASRLIITRAQRDELIASLQAGLFLGGPIVSLPLRQVPGR